MVSQNIIDSLILMAGYTVWIFVLYFLFNALTMGFFKTYLKVRTSMGRKVLVKVRGITHYYYKTGVIDDGMLTYKTPKKEVKEISCSPESIGRTMAVNFVVVDEETNAVIKPDLEGVTGYDAVKVHNLHVRALQAPKLGDDKNKIVMLLLIGCLIAIVIVGLLVFQQGQVLASLQAAANNNIVPTTAGL